MGHVSTAELADRLEQDGTSYVEVLNEASMRVELARYPNPEPKLPHREDELYVVLSGSGTAHVGAETHGVEEGDVIYVEQGVEHDFADIDDELTALVVFTDAEESVLDRGA
jgi:mannose-1-phosphate guanylyltransferase